MTYDLANVTRMIKRFGSLDLRLQLIYTKQPINLVILQLVCRLIWNVLNTLYNWKLSLNDEVTMKNQI